MISNRHGGILTIMTKSCSGCEFPHSHYMFCMRYLATNVETSFKNVEVKKLFIKATSATQGRKFDKFKEHIGKVKDEARKYFLTYHFISFPYIMMLGSFTE